MDSTTRTAEPINAGNAASADTGGRDSKRRMRGTPGNPFARQTATLRQAALDAVSEDDMRDIFTALKEKAKKGDVAASRLVLSYTVGKPGAAADPDTLDQHEFKTIIDKHSQSIDDLDRVIEGTPIELVLLMLRACLPALAEIKKNQAVECFNQPPQTEGEGKTMSPEEEREPGYDHAMEFAESEAETEATPDWMREIVAKGTAAAQVAKESMIPLDEMVRRLQEMTHAIAKRAYSQSGGVDAELLRALRERNGEAAMTPSG